MQYQKLYVNPFYQDNASSPNQDAWSGYDLFSVKKEEFFIEHFGRVHIYLGITLLVFEVGLLETQATAETFN